jgi:gamma-glutamyltranspeptidase/glutathione hydrolase
MAALRNSGQRVRDVGSFGAGGSALVVGIDPTTGRLCGGADPRQDAVVAGE